jgi:hypothetical protein
MIMSRPSIPYASISRRPFAVFLLIAFVGLLGYGNSLRNQFMLDDYVVLLGDRGVEHMSLGALLTSHTHIYYRPVGHLILLLSYHLFKRDPLGYHLVNLLLFIVMAYLFFVITQRLFYNRALGVLTALFIAVHPIYAMLVNYITASVLSTYVLTLQISFLLYIFYDGRRERVAWYVLSLLFFIASMFSHEMSLMMPWYVACAAYFLRDRSWKIVIRDCVPYVILVVGYVIFRYQFSAVFGYMMKGVSLAFPAFAVYIYAVMNLIGWYIGKLFIPVQILFLWNVQTQQSYFVLEPLKFVVIVLALVYLIFYRWRRGIKPFALSVFVGGFLPCFWASYAYFPHTEPLIEPHWFYFSAYGFFLLIAHGLLSLRNVSRPWVWAMCVGALLSVHVFLLRQQNPLWRDQETYCRYWISLNQNNPAPYEALTATLMAQGRFLEAERYGRRSSPGAPVP